MDIKWVEDITVFTHPGVRFYREHDNPEHVKVIRVDEIEAFFREGKPAYSTERIKNIANLISMQYRKENHPYEWGKIFEDNVVASAIIDILVHHARIFYINGRELERGIKTKMRVKLAAKMLIITWTLMKKKEVFNPGCIAD